MNLIRTSPWLNDCQNRCDERQVWFPTSSKDRSASIHCLFIFNTMAWLQTGAFIRTELYFCQIQHRINLFTGFFYDYPFFPALNCSVWVDIWLCSFFFFSKGSFLCPCLDPLPASLPLPLFFIYVVLCGWHLCRVDCTGLASPPPQLIRSILCNPTQFNYVYRSTSLVPRSSSTPRPR